MRSVRLALLAPAAVAMIVMSGCTDGDDTTAAEPAGSSASAPATPSAPSASPTPAGLDAATRTTCAAADKDITAALKEVASAEKIGPPAGHSAVSAQYSAGAATLYTHAFTSSDEVNAAVKDVATEMSDLADTWAKAPKKAPSKADLTAARDKLKATCAAA
ncbi:hypothetical protein O7600_14290 [Micromonospora sp. WMMA1998]|uniref:hypothetical protein n=1 Tax=Micromonospora sp. WMMA1998 TaxID=3015167 RepID=UPI00248AA2E9|nr:hypothetical protein [Micromonospora sp. WMMA1998]WBC17911.1 hypothetical protein O7600_14290 [Micromonospora sp. WMMA1998]